MTDFQSMKNLSKAIDFAKRNLLAGNKIILVCCQNGEDIIICVSLAIVTLLFDDNGKSNLDYKNYSRYDFVSLAKMVQQRF